MNPVIEGPTAANRMGGRHSRRVDRLRFVLPAIAALLLAVVMAWPWVNGGYHGLIVPVFNRTAGDDADLMRMMKPRYVGQTETAEPYEVTASSAFLDPGNPDRIRLDQLTAVLEKTGAEDVRLRANEGVYHRDRSALDLDGDLELTFGGGYRFNTASAKVDLGKGQVVGPMPVTGEGPVGSLAADRFNIEDGGKILRFDGRVQVTILPEAPAT